MVFYVFGFIELIVKRSFIEYFFINGSQQIYIKIKLHLKIMEYSKHPKQIEDIRKEADTILNDMKKSLDIFKTILNSAIDDKINISITEGRTSYKRQIINSIKNNQFPDQIKVHEELESVDKSQFSKIVSTLVDNKIIAEINRIHDPLKINPKAKKSYDFNLVTFHLLKYVRYFSELLQNLKPKKFDTILDYQLALIEEDFYDLGNISIVAKSAGNTKIQSTIDLMIKCNKPICRPDFCKNQFFFLFKDIIHYLDSTKFDIKENIRLVVSQEEDYNCQVIIKIPKRG